MKFNVTQIKTFVMMVLVLILTAFTVPHGTAQSKTAKAQVTKTAKAVADVPAAKTEQPAADTKTPLAAAATTAKPAVPVLDDLEQSYIQVVTLSQQLAYSECQRLESVQKFNATLSDAIARIEARHPGYTLVNGALAPKPVKDTK